MNQPARSGLDERTKRCTVYCYLSVLSPAYISRKHGHIVSSRLCHPHTKGVGLVGRKSVNKVVKQVGVLRNISATAAVTRLMATEWVL